MEWSREKDKNIVSDRTRTCHLPYTVFWLNVVIDRSHPYATRPKGSMGELKCMINYSLSRLQWRKKLTFVFACYARRFNDFNSLRFTYQLLSNDTREFWTITMIAKNISKINPSHGNWKRSATRWILNNIKNDRQRKLVIKIPILRQKFAKLRTNVLEPVWVSF